MEQLLPILISLGSGALGGNIAGKVMKSGMGTMGRSLTGIVGGGGLGAVLALLQSKGIDTSVAADAMGANSGGALDPMSILKSVAGGGVGGGILTAILGMVTGKK